MEFDTPQQRDKFILSNLRLVVSMVRKWNNGNYNEDLFQEGTKALIRATDGFDRSRGVAFSTYAVPFIDVGIWEYKRSNSVIRPYTGRNKRKFQYMQIVKLHDGIYKINDEICGSQDKEFDREEIDKFLNSLSERNKTIFQLLLDGNTHEKISEVVGTHRTYVTKIISKEIRKYRESYNFIE